jgi:hypothetical protein
MIREVIRPQYTNYTITIPTSYIDKDVEFIMFPLEDREIETHVQEKNNKSLRGIFNQYANSSKIALEESAWQNHILDKYKQHD